MVYSIISYASTTAHRLLCEST